MSLNKMKYFEVNTVTVVQANNKTEAEKLARGRRGVAGKAIVSDTYVERITAAEANSLIEA